MIHDRMKLHPPIDRAGWPSGPWDTEPDRVCWQAPTGQRCLMLRHPESGAWTGYVDCPKNTPVDHPLAGVRFIVEGIPTVGFDAASEAGEWPPCVEGYRALEQVKAQVEDLAAACPVPAPGSMEEYRGRLTWAITRLQTAEAAARVEHRSAYDVAADRLAADRLQAAEEFVCDVAAIGPIWDRLRTRAWTYREVLEAARDDFWASEVNHDRASADALRAAHDAYERDMEAARLALAGHPDQKGSP